MFTQPLLGTTAGKHSPVPTKGYSPLSPVAGVEPAPFVR